MAQENQGIKIARAIAAVDAANALSRPRTLDLWKKLLEAEKSNSEKARSEKNQGWSSALSAICQTALIIAGKALENSSASLKPIGAAMSAAASPLREGLSISKRMKDATITIEGHKTETARLAQRTLQEQQNSIDSTSARLLDMGARVIEKDRI